MDVLTRINPSQRASSRGLPGKAAIAFLGGLLLSALVHVPTAYAVDPNANREQERATTISKKQVAADEEARRNWSVDALFETHFTVIRDNLYSNDVYHQLYLRANYDIPRLGSLPPLGRVTLRLSTAKYYIADPGESGFLFGDVFLTYSYPLRFKVLGQEFGLRSYFTWTFPTSKLSRQESNIARPTLLLALSKQMPWNINLFLRNYYRLNWARYSTMEGGNPNRRWWIGYELQATYDFHLHKALSVGATFGQSWYNYYSGPTGADQPWNQWYYWETFVGYSLPFKAVHTAAYLTLANNRPRVMEDGVSRYHLFDRDETEVYLTLLTSY